MAEKTRILLVDDEPDIVKTVERRLQSEGYDVLIAVDGMEALEKARTEKPDLIVLDLLLPKLDGYRVCALLKKDIYYARVPVIMFTSRIQEKEQKLGFDCGADAYITKPFDSQDLLKQIKTLLGQKPTTPEIESST